MLMRKGIITALFVAAIIFSGNLAFAYVIDGSLADWGIDLFASGADTKGYLDTNLPSGGRDIDVVTEDNADRHTNFQYVGPGLTWKNFYDAEALYFDNNKKFAYIALVSGFPRFPDMISATAGDIGFDINGDGWYEYALRVADFHLLSSVTDWSVPVDYPGSYPLRAIAGTDEGKMKATYSDEQNSHYVWEARIPLKKLGLSAKHGDPIQSLKIHWTMSCGNDALDLNGDVNPASPEPATLSLLGLGLLGLLFKRKVRVS